MGVLSGYLRLQIGIVVAVALAAGSVTVATGLGGIAGLLTLIGLVGAGFAVLTALFSLR
jgi:hypothetical protein